MNLLKQLIEHLNSPAYTEKVNYFPKPHYDYDTSNPLTINGKAAPFSIKDKAEQEIKNLHDDEGLIFDYSFDWNNVNKFLFCIEKEGYSMKDIVSKLKEGEKLLFYLNCGQTWNGKMGDDCKMFYDKKRDGSIYCKPENCGDCVRVGSDMGSIYKWGMELARASCANNAVGE